MVNILKNVLKHEWLLNYYEMIKLVRHVYTSSLDRPILHNEIGLNSTFQKISNIVEAS